MRLHGLRYTDMTLLVPPSLILCGASASRMRRWHECSKHLENLSRS